MADEMKPAYLIAGDDEAKLSAALARLRARAEREGGAGALEAFVGAGGGPDVEALAAALPAMSLTAERRYLLADGVERWQAAHVKRIAAALAEAPPDVTVVLVSRKPASKAPKGLAEAVRKSGGEVLAYDAPKRAGLHSWVVEEARRRGLAIDLHAARVLVARVGDRTARLASELDRLAAWAGEDGRIDADRVERLTADTSELKGWTLADAIIARDPEVAVGVADGLLAQGVDVTPLVYAMASRLRSAHQAAVALERGEPSGRIEASLPMAPYGAKLLVRAVRGTDPEALSVAIEAIADLEWWTRGGSDYGDDVALTLAVRRAAGGGG